MNFDNNALKSSSKFDSLQQDIHSSALLTKQNIDQLKTPDIRHGFTLGSLALLVPKNVKSEIIYAPTLYPLPNTPNWFSGFANHRGEALPIFYLEGLLNPHTLPKKNKQWLLFLEQQQKTCGLLLNSCPYKLDNLLEIPTAQVLNIPTLLNPYVNYAFYDGSRQWLDFSYHHFFLSLKSAF